MTLPKFLPFCLTLVLLLTACGRQRPVVRGPAPTPTTGEKPAPLIQPGYTETGYASWYGDPYHGRRAANGEIYDKNKLTAAHLTLPFGSLAKVTNFENNRSVTVRITDRGPFVKGRIIDLSLAAAREIQMIGPGTALVRLEILSLNGKPDSGIFVVQVGAFRDRSRAERLQQQLRGRYGGAFVEDYDSSQGRLYRVRLGPKPSLMEANQLATQLGSDDLPAFVVRLDN
ncbi:MAG: septal ring lytic transglycosylase RlpA family protein [Acidobacteria bacterium]|nr:septal ring lytic transglycosylase RlpA family protein [Acidobacteriota bacterium]